ncbi:hypothetical protein ACFWSF_32490 [Streptomyces sp. NPDC058611]|uniref:hypothetical protein n=1 Tax=unclassified Streptomyces TaxID=2593676 RepID=UPI00365E19C0
MNLTRVRRRIVNTVAASALAAGALLGSAPTASAGEVCDGGCSQTYNDTGGSVVVARNWCWGLWEGWQRSGDDVVRQCNSNDKYALLSPWTRTSGTVDWDTFRVDRGWCYRVYFYNDWTGGKTWHTFDRTGSDGLWIKVSNYESAHIYSRTYGRC